MTTLDEFMAIDPNSYMARVEGWRPRTAALKANYDDYKRWANAPAGTYWSGKTATAAQDVAADDCKGVDNADDTTEDAVKLVTATITYEVIKPLTNGQNIVNNALHQGVSVGQDFRMAYTPAEGESEESIARNRKIVADAERELQGYVAQWEKGEATLKTQTDAAREAMLSRINPKAAFADGRKILRDAVAPKPGDGPPGTATATSVNYKELYPKTTDPASGQTVAAADPHAPVLGPPAPGDKPPVDPSKLGGLTGNLGVMGITDPKSPLDKPPPPPDARSMPAPKLDPNTPQGKAAIDKFRSILATQYPPDQVEAKLSEAIKGAQQDRPMVATPEPGTPERVRQSGGGAFAESWDQAGRAKDDLLGINGGDHAKEAWKGVAKGLWDVVNPDPVHQVERGIDQAKGAIDEVKSGIDNPKAFIGKHGIEIAAGIATAPVGGEGALLGTEGRALTHGLEDTTHHLPETPSGATHPGPAVDHPSPPTVGDHTPTYQPPAPHEFDPGGGQHYTSGDPHHPGGWPPGTPEATWSKGDTEPGWKYINHNVDKDWMPYQQQIGGLERTPTGALPEWAQPNPETGVPVDFDGHTHRGPQEVFLEAKDGYRGMAFAPDNTYWQGRADKAIDQVDRQLAAIPPGAKLEWHVSDPYGAAALRKLFIDNDIYGVDVIYTPKAP
ncbi:Tox-REase-5 domain-containing protein [Mycobacteroides chelonae]|nr:Tox-REase-5 domain-containing protein [Mycobacteroides chelonae]